ncbi:MAG: lysophospholipase [Deltaproteobacteria bacterium]|nr:lysophospholipase [Candidatus Zymogenaceae bacterium]
MKSGTITLKARDGAEIFVYTWKPDDEKDVKAVIQIAHGMAEHAARYERFANALVDEGFAVYADDHRGHGKTAGSLDRAGFFADEDGWQKVVDDLAMITDHMEKEYPKAPVFFFGHSMGSMLGRTYLLQHGKRLSGAILSGTMGDPGLLGKLGVLVAKRECKKKGRNTPSELLAKLSFGKFNNAFKPARTEFDWLSRDEAEVDKYVDDPYCGFVFSAGGFLDMLTAMPLLFKPEGVARMPKTLPIYLFSGEKDPVGNNGKGVREVYNLYKKAGIEDVSIKLYENGRHEMLNETNRKEVFSDVIGWLNAHMPK